MATVHNLYDLGVEQIAISEPARSTGRDITIQNVNLDGYIYVGGNGVTDENYGYRLMPNHAISFELDRQDDLYVIGSREDMKVAVLSINLEGKD
jgi:hypothetical protein